MTNREIAEVFDRVADLLELKGSNPFRVRAYRNGARRISDLGEALSEIASSDTQCLTDLEGIGKDLADKIVALLSTGSLPLLDELIAEIPPGLLAVLRVPGLGPKKVAAVYRELDVESLGDLRRACEQGKVRTLKGFGAKTEASILKGLDLAERAERRTRWVDAARLAEALRTHLAEAAGVRQLQLAGSYRRGRETVGDLDVLADSDDPNSVMDRLESFSAVGEVLLRGDTKISVRLITGMQVDLRVVPPESYGSALQYFTGSKEHNILIRSRARQCGLKVSEWGVFRLMENQSGEPDQSGEPGESDEYVAGRTEEEVYAALGLSWIPPELREARQEVAWAAEDALPRLIELSDICGDLHMHTSATDGKATLAEMVEAARLRGLQYIAITDHSQRVAMARGLNPERLRRQWEEIDRINAEQQDVVVLKGIECDILEAGGMDLPDDVLEEADWVIGSVHYGQNQPRAQITERILGALENPYVSIIAHPTGRLINRRDPYDVDLTAVMEAAVRLGKSLELNANPARLDLDDAACAHAKRLGIPIAISTDAHQTEGLDVMRHGIQQARRGGLTADDVLNTLPWEAFQKRLRRSRTR